MMNLNGLRKIVAPAGTGRVAWSTDHFYRQRMQALVDKFLHGIIHKAMARHAGLSIEM